MTQESRNCHNCKQNFTIEPEDFEFYERMQVPPPTFCPECRMVRRFIFRGEHFLNKATNLATGKEIFSGIPRESPYKVYDRPYWWSDKWDPMSYGRDYDFSRSFFEQFGELMRDVPWCASTTMEMVDSDYCEQASRCKNCYLCFDVDNLEDSSYLVNSGYDKDCYDQLSSFESELCYEGIRITKGYKVHYSENCDSCNEVWFSRSCSGCSFCFGCVNLKNKQYHIYNEAFSKEEYFRKLEELNLDSSASEEKIKREADEFWQKYPVKYIQGQRLLSSSGEYLSNTKNVKNSYLTHDAENSKYLQLDFYGTTDSYDFTVWGEGASRVYECLACGLGISNIKFCFNCWPNCQELEYCVTCGSSKNLFACVGLRNKEYCIFNKQYSKDEYFQLRNQIVGQMAKMPYVDKRGVSYGYGEFFPHEYSPYSYNESFAQDVLPLSKEDVLRNGFLWRDPDKKGFTTTMDSAEIPDSISDVKQNIVEQAIKCSDCGRAYRITQQELQFHTRFTLPLPRICFDCRTKEKFAKLNPPKLWQRKCQCAGTHSANNAYTNLGLHEHGDSPCSNEFETSHSPEKAGTTIYCESCYNAEVA